MEQEILKQLERIERNTLLAAKNILNLEDLAVLTGMSKSHLYKLTCGKKIPFYRPNGKQIYFERKEIENWLRRNRIASEDEIEEMAVDLGGNK